MNQKDYWNSVADTKEFTTPFRFNEFNKYVNKKSHILDIGCGYGRTLNELYENGYENLLGIDFSEKMIKRGKLQYPYLNLKAENTTNLKDNSFDAVILFAVLTCIKDNAEQIKLISEIKRILKDGGILYVNDFLLNSDERNIKRYKKYENVYGTYGVFKLPEGGILRHHDEKWIKKLLCEFSPLCYNHVTFKTMNGHTSNGFYYIGKKE